MYGGGGKDNFSAVAIGVDGVMSEEELMRIVRFKDGMYVLVIWHESRVVFRLSFSHMFSS